MNLRKRYLDDLLGRDILVVTMDSRTFKGRLVEYDEEAMLLDDVIETSTREIKWRRPEVALPATSSGSGGNVIHPLNEVMVLTAQVLRIWRLE